MKVRALHTRHVSTDCRPRLRRRGSWCLLSAVLVCAAGCVGEDPADDVAAPTYAPEAHEVSPEEPGVAVLRSGSASATPETVGGFCRDGAGVYLSATQDAAELLLYVVTPAQRATFSRPALYLTTREGDHSKTEVAEFEDVTLEAGESLVLQKEATGVLMEVLADFAPTS